MTNITSSATKQNFDTNLMNKAKKNRLSITKFYGSQINPTNNTNN